jgi:hypothetical protein
MLAVALGVEATDRRFRVLFARGRPGAEPVGSARRMLVTGFLLGGTRSATAARSVNAGISDGARESGTKTGLAGGAEWI